MSIIKRTAERAAEIGRKFKGKVVSTRLVQKARKLSKKARAVGEKVLYAVYFTLAASHCMAPVIDMVNGNIISGWDVAYLLAYFWHLAHFLNSGR